MRDGSAIRGVVYKPEPTTEKNGRPLFIYFHGGGYVFGAPEFAEQYFAMLVNMGVTVVGVAYRLAPEYVFPTAVWDAIDAVEWVRRYSLSFLFLLFPASFHCEY